MPATGARVELQLGSTWTDVTDYTYLRNRIRITRGRQDEGTRVDPSSCTITFNNKLGRFSPRNPMGPYYGLLGRNTPVRVTVAAGEACLFTPGIVGTRASTSNTAALDIIGPIDLRVDVRLRDWGAGGNIDLLGKWSPGALAYRLGVNLGGYLAFGWSEDGAASFTTISSVPLPAVPGDRLSVRATLAPDDGAGRAWTAFYYSTTPGVGGPWTLLGEPFLVPFTTSIASTSAPLDVGDTAGTSVARPTTARFYAAQVRDGIGAGAPVAADVDFTAQTPGATSFTDTSGLPWTLSGQAEITDRLPRFTGEISEWPARWDVSGSDVYTSVQAAGIMRRLGQGASPLDSTLKRRIPSDANVVAYWPMEETGGTQAYSPIAGVRPMSVVGMQWAADDSLAGSLALPGVQSPCSISGAVPLVAGSTQWRVEFVYKIPTAPATASTLINFGGNGTVRRWTVRYQSGTATVLGAASDGTLIVNQPIGIGTGLFGSWVRQQFTVSESGGTVTWSIGWLVVGESGGGLSGTYSGTAGACTSVSSVFSTGTVGASLGHIAVFKTAASSIFDSADTGFDGEDSWSRIARLCGEEGVTVIAPYGREGVPALGPQTPSTLLDLLDEAADADVGILYEPRELPALAYRTRTSLYNQPVRLALDYSARGEVAPDLTPTEDDQATRNDITVSRPDGSSARASLDTGTLSTLPPPSGVGRYATSETVNVWSDGQLDDIAGWLLLLGTWDEARYPQVTVNLAAGPWLRDAVCAVDVADRITISNPPPWLPPETIDLIAQGSTETIGWADWAVTFNCTPAGPWSSVAVVDGSGSRAATDGSELAADVDADDTTLTVTTTDGPPWIDTSLFPDEFPFDIEAGGERMQVTAIGGVSSPQTFTVTRAVNGITKDHPAGTSVQLARPVYVAL